MRLAFGAACILIFLLWLFVFPRPSGDRGRPDADAAALRAIQAIHTAEVQYNSQYGRYAGSLAELAALIDRDPAGGARQGYRFSLTGNGTAYVVIASGRNKSFCSDQTMIIRVSRAPEASTAGCRELQELH